MGLFSFQSNRPNGAARAAFEALVREHHRGLLAFARSLVADAGEAEDLVQEAFVVAWRKLDRFESGRDFGSWLRGILRFEYRRWARKRRDVPVDDEVLDLIDELHAGIEENLDDRNAVFELVRQCVAALPESLRETVKQVYATGLSCPEIAEAQGASETSIRKRLQRGREKVAACLQSKSNLPLFEL